MADIFAPYFQQRDRQRAARTGTGLVLSDTNPDDLAKSLAVGRELGVPGNVVQAAPQMFQQQLETKRNTTALSGAPRLTDWLSDPTNGGLARDDVSTLTAFERMSYDWISDVGTATGADKIVTPVTDPIARTVSRMMASPSRMTAAVRARRIGDVGRTLEEITAEEMEAAGGEGAPAASRVLALQSAKARFDAVQGMTPEDVERMAGEGAEALATGRRYMEMAAAIEMPPEAAAFLDQLMSTDNDIGSVLGAFANNPVGAASLITQVGLESIPMLAAMGITTAATGSPMAGAFAMGASSGLVEDTAGFYDFLNQEGIDISTPEAALAAISDPEIIRRASEYGATRGFVIAAFDTISGQIAGQTLSKSPAGNMALQTVVQALAGGGGEAAATVATGEEIDWRDVVLEAMAEVVTAPVEVIGLSIPSRRRGESESDDYTPGGGGLLHDLQRAVTTGQTAARLSEIDRQAEASKLRQRDPEKFLEAMEAAGLREQFVYVPADGVTELFQSEVGDAELATLGLERADYEEQLSLGGDVAIPLSHYAANFAGTERATYFQRNGTLSPGEMSAAEAEAFREGIGSAMSEAVQRVEESTQRRAEMVAEDQEIYDSMFGQLRTAGRTPGVAEQEARVFTAFLRTMGERYGATPRELAARFGVEVRGGGTAVADAAAARAVPDTPSVVEPVPSPAQDVAITATGREIPVTYRVVEASSLVTSQTDDGRTNPAFPAALQPRDRSRGTSDEQIRRIAASLDPRLLGPMPSAADGAPIIGPDGVVESGNGRVLAIRRAYAGEGERASAYRDYIASLGYDVTGVSQPVLVRERAVDLDDTERQAFTREANERSSMELSDTERAMADAAALPDSALALYTGGDVDLAQNRDFVRAFITGAVAQGDQGSFIDAEGRMSQRAVRRVQAALLARAYGDASLVEAVMEVTDGNIRAIGGALMDVAPVWAQMRREVEAGTIAPEMDQTGTLLEAVNVVRRARDEGRPVMEFVGQSDMFTGETMNPMAEGFLRLLFRDPETLKRPAGRARVAEALAFYVDEARKTSPGADLLGETADPVAIIQAAKERQYEDPDTQARLFTQPARSTGDGDSTISGDGDRAAPVRTEGPIGAGVTGRGDEATRLTPEVLREPGRRLRLQDLDDGEQAVFMADLKVKQGIASVDDLMARAAANHAALGEALQSIAADIGAVAKIPPAKSRKRIEEKIASKYAEREAPQNYITDAARGGFDVTTRDQSDDIVARLSERFSVVDEGWTVTDEGYFDRKVLVIFADGQIGEVQVWPPGMLEAKEERGGHEAYEIYRSPESTEEQRVEARGVMLDLYGQVFAALDPVSWSGILPPSASTAAETVASSTSSVRSDPQTADGSLTGSQVLDDGSNRSTELSSSSMAGSLPSSMKNRIDGSPSTSDIDADGAGVNGRTLFQAAPPDPEESVGAYADGQARSAVNGEDRTFDADLLAGIREADSVERAMQFADQWTLDRGKKTGNEHFVAMDVWGGLIGATEGSMSSVNFPDYVYQVGLEGSLAYATHNHPRNSGFSVPDLQLGLTWGTTITAMGKAGAVATASAGPVFANKRTTPDMVGLVMARVDGAVRGYLQDLINAGSITVDQAIAAHTHSVDLVRHRHSLINLSGNGFEMVEGSGIDVEAIYAATDKEVQRVLERNQFDVHSVRDFDRNRPFGGAAVVASRSGGATGVPDADSQGSERAGNPLPQNDPRQLRLLEQGTMSGPRGSIELPAGGLEAGTTIINLFENADLSTFLHESGHFFLEAFTALATDATAPEQMRNDLDAIYRYLGAEPGKPFETKHHEMFARTAEAYFLEGKAPSLELADVFARLKSWLVRIYRTVRGLDVPINDEIRGVFDRMLATDEEIAAMRETLEMGPLFSEPPAGMTENDWKVYQRMARRGQEQAEQNLLAKTMERIAREKKDWYKAEKKAVREQVAAEVNGRPEHRLIEMLANGRWIGNDEADLPDMRIDRKALVEQFGEGVLSEIDRSRIGGKRAIYGKDGAAPQEVAEFFGFPNAAAMVDALRGAGKRRDVIDAEVERVMLERYGDPFEDGAIEQEAAAAVHAEQQMSSVVMEARHLARQLGRDTRGMTAKLYRQRAKLMIGRMSVAQASRPAQFLQAERRAAREAQQAFARVARGTGGEGVIAAAFQAKEQQLLNQYLYDEARRVSEEVRKGREKMLRYGSRSVRRKLEGGYIEQIDAILEQYDFRKRSPGQVQRSESLADFVARMEAEGRADQLAIDPRVIEQAQKRHFSRLSVDELRGLFDTIENIDHLGRLKQKLIDAQEQRDLDRVVEGVTQALADNVSGSPPNRTETRGERVRSGIRQFLNTTLNADTLLREVDGFKDLGPAWTAMKQKIDEGMNRLVERRVKMAKSFDAIYAEYSAKEKRDMSIKRHNPALGGLFSKWDIISLALNTGNEDNYQRITNPGVKGSFTPDQVQSALEGLDARDWKVIQSTWDYINSFWPEIEAKERRQTGVAPAKVPGKVMVRTAAQPASVTGGYYPIKYDGRLSGLTNDYANKELADSVLGGQFGKAQTRNGHTKERLSSSRQPVQLDLGVAHAHVDQVIYDLEIGEAVSNSWKILQDARVKEGFYEKGKKDDHDALELWLLDVASGERIAAGGFWSLMRHLRTGFTVSRLAINVSTALIQPTGLTQSMVVVGKRAVARGTVMYLSHPFRWVADVRAVSPMMRERMKTFERDIYNVVGDLEAGPVTGRWQKFQRDVVLPTSFFLMQKVQFFSVDMPTWVSAYQKELDISGDEARARLYADAMVKRSQGSGLMSDRGMFERGTLGKGMRQHEAPRMLTALGSYMFAKFNVAYERTGRTNFRNPVEVMHLAADLALLFTLEAVLYSVVKDFLPDEDEDTATWLAKETALSAMSTLPFARELSGALAGFGGGGIFGSSVEALARPMIQSGQGEYDKALVKSYINATGLLLHLPASQTNAAIEALFEDDMSARRDVKPMQVLGLDREGARSIADILFGD